MNKIAIENGYFVIITNTPQEKRCIIELGASVAEDGLKQIILDEYNGFLRFFINDSDKPEKIMEKNKDQTFEEFIDAFINSIYESIGIDKSLYFKKSNGKLVEYYG